MKKLYILSPVEIGEIKEEIYGHFTEHIGGVFYDGLWVGEDSDIPNTDGFRLEIIEKLKQLAPPVIRWPGGCFAEIYDWRDGIGPREKRPVRINWWQANDGRTESNAVGTHEFIHLCKLVGAKPYIAANITSATPLHIRDWIDYCNSENKKTSFALEREANGSSEPFKVTYWGIGNENWGGGGHMRPEYYADEFRRYSEIAHNADPSIKCFACGPNAADYEWTRRFFAQYTDTPLKRTLRIDGYAMHYYCGNTGNPLEFNDSGWYQQLTQAQTMDRILNRHWSYIKGYGMEEKAKLVIDEWGCWHPGGSGPSKGYNLFEQQSTIRDGMVAAMTLNIFNNNADKIIMANCAQLVNNLHSLFLAGGKNCIVTPTYHVFDMYKGHQGGRALKTADNCGRIEYINLRGERASIPALSSSASFKDGMLTLTVCNSSCTDEAVIEIEPVGMKIYGEAKVTLLADEDYHAYNSFEEPDRVKTISYTFDSDTQKYIKIPKAGIMSLCVAAQREE